MNLAFRLGSRSIRAPLATRLITTTPTQSPRVHVLGLGSIGSFAAHSLAEIPSPPSITLLLHRASLLDEYRANGSQITLERNDGTIVNHSDYSFEVLHGDSWRSASPELSPINDTIENLILSVKGYQTVDALRPLKHRLGPNSTILFLQNGCGMIDEANEHLFADPATRPNYIIGVTSHGVGLNSPFNITHTGFAATSLGPVPRSLNPDSACTANTTNNDNYLLQTLPLVPQINGKSHPYPTVFQHQLEKLAVNAFSNPISALNNAPVDNLRSIPGTRRALTREISRIIQALPELQSVPGIAERFSPARLDETVKGVIEMNARTTVSMVWDLRAGRETEIQYINGYWARRGRELGIPTPINDALVARVVERTVEVKRGRRKGAFGGGSVGFDI
ncbi:hypothetical protein FQN50_000275 [Emmonsiellopsis sp. PD_5]|nr:hypothetical protein FQN50_000275 [Emmonsiellopsis sp. PD_5]